MSDLPQAGRERRPPWAALAISAALLVVAAVIVLDMQRFTTAGAYDRIGPTAVPHLVAGALVLLALGTAVKVWRGTFPLAEPQALGPVAIITAGLLLQLALLPATGFVVSSAALFTCVALGFGERRVHITFPFALVFSALIWFVFARLLKLTLPEGAIERWLLTITRNLAGFG